jgi:hypothetical protein
MTTIAAPSCVDHMRRRCMWAMRPIRHPAQLLAQVPGNPAVQPTEDTTRVRQGDYEFPY